MNFRVVKMRFMSIAVIMLVISMIMTSCKIKYSLSAAAIPIEVKTVSIANFPNNALLVAPILSTTFTQALQDRFIKQSRLMLVKSNGDMNFEGEIINYTSTPASISGDEQAVLNRLTISVRVRFTNAIQPQNNFDRTFSAFADYPSSKLLQSVESSLIPEIVEQLVEDIFNAAVSNW